MATNWKSTYNSSPFIPLSESDVIRIVNKALSSYSKRTTTYKYAFFKSILDNLFNANITTYFLSFDAIALRFTEIYWNLILYYGLHQMSSYETDAVTGVEKVLFDFCKNTGLIFSQKQTICIFESLRSDLQLKISNKIKSIMKKYVVGAFCGDTEDQFYHFDFSDKINDGIFLNHDVYISLVKYKSSFEKQNYFEWIKFLEKVNKEEDSYALANKLDSSTERKNLSPYRNILIDFGQKECFYCGKRFSLDSANDILPIGIPVDHFIPWSYVKDDKLWNFVLACPTCNSKKSNTLPNHDLLKNLKIRNSKLCNFNHIIVKKDFSNYSDFTLDYMFNSAYFNGFKGNWSV